MNFKSGSDDTLELQLPAGTLRSGQIGLVSYVHPGGELELSRDGESWETFATSESFSFSRVPDGGSSRRGSTALW